ncbi:dTDP-4-dehydrorhamnose 3,5-epimerase family protein [candidate division KSB1 bacterium]|nr:dTDP-4-dehydrorhamnose 3,5-epimerase family protein [candidate division KSB1 bacterium]
MRFQFQVTESNLIKGVWIIKPSVSSDLRGNIWTSFLKEEIERLLPPGLYFKHDKFSESKKNVLRGIHGDKKSWKLVTCVYGKIQQVVVDCRKESVTYLKWHKFIINKENQFSVLIPPNMGNAYFVSSDVAVYHYKLAYNGDYIDADNQFSLNWNDSRIGIDWPNLNPILSDRDK